MQAAVRLLTSGEPEVEDCVQIFRRTLINFYKHGTPEENELVFLLVRTPLGETPTEKMLCALEEQFGTQTPAEIDCILRIAHALFWDQGTHLDIVSPYAQ